MPPLALATSITSQHASLPHPSTPTELFSSSSSSAAADTITNIVFGIAATIIGTVTIYQAHRAWRIWHASAHSTARHNGSQAQEGETDPGARPHTPELFTVYHELDAGNNTGGNGSRLNAGNGGRSATPTIRTVSSRQGSEGTNIPAVDRDPSRQAGEGSDRPAIDRDPSRQVGQTPELEGPSRSSRGMLGSNEG